MVILYILLACILSSIFYRMGGAKSYNAKFRDWGCPLVLLCLVGALFGFKWALWWVYAIVFGLSWGALTTYGDKIFGYDNFYFHGFLCGLSSIPLVFVGIPWWLILIRTIICTLGMGLWSKYQGNDVKEELGRGFFYII